MAMQTQKQNYQNYTYWSELIKSDANLWEDGFLNLPPGKDDIYLFTFFLDMEKGIVRQRFAYYPDLESLKGFLEYVFMPTSIFHTLDHFEEGFNVPIMESKDLLEYFKSHNTEEELLPLEELCSELNGIIDSSHYQGLEGVKTFSDLWNSSQTCESKRIHFKVFDSPNEIEAFVLNRFMGDEDDLVEEFIGMGIESFKHMCRNLNNKPFMRNRFTQILNNKVSYLY